METGAAPAATILSVGADFAFVADVAENLETDDVEVLVQQADDLDAARDRLRSEAIDGLVVGAGDASGDWESLVADAEAKFGVPTLAIVTSGDQRASAAAAGATAVLVRHGDEADATILERHLEYFAERRAVERELDEQASLLDHIFNQVPSALYVKDEQGRHVRKRNFEGDPEEFYGKTDLEIYEDTEFARETYADDMRVIEDGERIINKEEYNSENDQWTLTSKVPWHDEDGNVQGLIGVSRIITEKKRYEEELRLRNRAIEEAPIGIVIYDVAEDGRSIRYANEGMEELTDYDRGAIEGGTVHLLDGPETDDHQMSALDSAFADGQAASIVTLLYRRDRTPFWGHFSVAPVTNDDGEVTHFVGFLQDVTETKEHEQSIERRLDEFGDVLARQLRPPLQDAADALSGVSADDDSDLQRAKRAIERADTLVDDLAEVNSFSVKPREVSESVADGRTLEN